MTIHDYCKSVNALYKSGISTEHSFRTALQNLIDALLPQYNAINEPKRISCGAPDYVLIGKKDSLPYAYIEAKDLFDNDLAGVGKNKEQFFRYRQSLSRIIFTDYLRFYFYVDGEKIQEVTLLDLDAKGNIVIAHEQEFIDTLNAWITALPQPISSANRLVTVMANKAKMLNTAILAALESNDTPILNLHGQFTSSLIPDLSYQDFADYLAQTITYGLFAARLYDTTLDTFSRDEAAKIIPNSNPFLKRLFQEIAGYNANDNIIWIIDDLALVFSQVNVHKLLYAYYQKDKDPLVHFYEDFLLKYNAETKAKLGVFYTPLPVVEFIVRAVDECLIHHFGLPMGLADNSTIQHQVRDNMGILQPVTKSRVQVLDPATGTGTFFAQTLRQIHSHFADNQGLWQSYVNDGLLARLHGFELLMAPYTIAHLKMALTLQETGATANERFNIFLTNSLQQAKVQQLFNFVSDEGRWAEKIKKETPVMIVIGNPPYSGESSNKGLFEDISLLSSMKGVDAYKIEPNSKDKLKEKNPKWINDDYVKFIRLGETFIERNQSGILAYITNNSFLDNPTFRGMRWHLLQTFDDMYIVNLHGNSKKKETCPDGSPDKNVFDIMQGVSINIFVRRSTLAPEDTKIEQALPQRGSLFVAQGETLGGGDCDGDNVSVGNTSLTSFDNGNVENSNQQIGVSAGNIGNNINTNTQGSTLRYKENIPNGMAQVHYIDLYGTRASKFSALNELSLPNHRQGYRIIADATETWSSTTAVGEPSDSRHLKWQTLTPTAPNYFFVPKDFELKEEYEKGISLADLFKVSSMGVTTARDEFVIHYTPQQACATIDRFLSIDDETARKEFRLGKDVRDWTVAGARKDLQTSNYEIVPIAYRPFDKRYAAYTGNSRGLMCYPRYDIMQHMLQDNNCALVATRLDATDGFKVFVCDHIVDKTILSSKDNASVFPLYLYDENGKRSLNMRMELLQGYEAEDFFAYIYAVLHSPSYRERYKEFLKIDFPRIPLPTDNAEYQRLIRLGKELIDLHLMQGGATSLSRPNYPIAGNNIVEKIKFVSSNSATGMSHLLENESKLYINDTQYFDHVPAAAYNLYIGGYQPAEKWLKDRKGRALTYNDICHYQRLIATLQRTDEIMKEIG